MLIKDSSFVEDSNGNALYYINESKLLPKSITEIQIPTKRQSATLTRCVSNHYDDSTRLDLDNKKERVISI